MFKCSSAVVSSENQQTSRAMNNIGFYNGDSGKRSLPVQRYPREYIQTIYCKFEELTAYDIAIKESKRQVFQKSYPDRDLWKYFQVIVVY